MDSTNSRVILAKGIAIDKSYNNVLNYTQNQMLSLLRSNSHLVGEYIGYSFIRETGYIEMQVPYSTALASNYIAFQNPDYSNKWFFAWVDDVEYRGENNSRIKYTIDCWSTWFENWTAKKCFVKRHHVNDDTIGKNIIPENLNVGDVICEASQNFVIDATVYIAVATTWLLSELKLEAATPQHPFGSVTATGDTSTNSVVNMLGNIMGNDLIFFPLTTAGIGDLKKFLVGVNFAGHSADVRNIYILPLKIDTTHTVTASGFHFYDSYTDPDHPVDTTIYYYRYAESSTPITISGTLTMTIDSFTGYTPKNNKCYCYPYNYLYVTNNIGNHSIMKIEDFSTRNSITFDYEFTCSIGASGRIVPKNYKGITRNVDESISLAKYPTCSWSSDAFTNWLTQNAVNIPMKMISTAVNMPSPETPGWLSSTSLNVASILGQFYEASLLPKMENGQASGDVNYTAGDNDFNVYRMRAKTEYLKIIDDYFTRFGYAIKKLEMPNITGRTYWNYVEIGDTEEIGYGDVPNKFMDVINNVARKGVTIWHNHDNIGNWDLANTIVTP